MNPSNFSHPVENPTLPRTLTAAAQLFHQSRPRSGVAVKWLSVSSASQIRGRPIVFANLRFIRKNLLERFMDDAGMTIFFHHFFLASYFHHAGLIRLLVYNEINFIRNTYGVNHLMRLKWWKRSHNFYLRSIFILNWWLLEKFARAR